MEKWIVSLTYFSALGAGLMAGLFFAFSTFVMTALERIPKSHGISAMQSINQTILNPLFGLVFGGTALACLVLAIISFFRLGTVSANLVLAASLLYLIGVILITMVCNVPLNDALAVVDPNSAAGADVWRTYLDRWLPWNHVRTIASIGSLVLFILALRFKS
ncbi:anthrone oxygenase family protein [Paenibacillus guangzhouensis]|uniref:anthrone oxygenase family protein n=1 Tax=Paenibacillus guangzhouensis TaxID=1473112 RepID=UPI001D120A5E|nr:anthrone oxygenase family protein [Paenibacillus guangzhouensis]